MMQLKLAVLFSGVVAIAAASALAADPEPGHEPAEPKPASSSAVADARGHFSVFQDRSAVVASDDHRRVARAIPRPEWVSSEFTRLAHRSARAAVYVLAGEGFLCLVREGVPEEGGSAGCTNDPAGAASGRRPIISVDAVEEGGAAWRVTALLPDGSSEGAIELHNGARREVALVNNVLTARTDGAPAALRWTTPRGDRLVQEFRGLSD